MIRIVLALWIVLGAPGCGSPPHKEEFTVKLIGKEDQNKKNPVVVRVYQLKKRANFDRAEYQNLRKNDDKFLDADLVEWKEIILYPGTNEVLDLQVYTGEGVEYLGVAAFFEEPYENSWKEIVSIQDRGFCEKPWFGDVKVLLGENKIFMETRC